VARELNDDGASEEAQDVSRRKHGRKREHSQSLRAPAQEAPAAPAKGDGLGGRYDVLYPLGVGGMADVFKARLRGPAGFERDVVVKRLRAANQNDQEIVDMFVDEARILGALHHQNIVTALDFGQENGRFFLVLEYIEGPSLGRFLRAGQRKMPAAVVAYVARELCRALEYMHRFEGDDGEALNLIHRDVTPSNILVTPTGAVKLLDFGVARFASATHVTDAGTVKGKTAYVAPEQLEVGKQIDGRVDLFALGTVMHELLAQERLFADETDLGTIRRIMQMEVPHPSRKSVDVPPELDRIVMKALARDPSDRYADAAAMARDLDGVVLACGVGADDVAAFVASVDTEDGSGTASRSRAPVVATLDPHNAPTRRDLRVPVPRRRTVTVGLAVALGMAGAFVLGFELSGARHAEPASASSATSATSSTHPTSPPLAANAGL
jgi:eukaryotic-like serine/threonine-protein kinase